MLFVPAAASVLFAGVLYIFVMPQLSSFTGLGLMIFAVTFAICYLFAAPRQGLGRAFGLAMFVTIASISNQQTLQFSLGRQHGADVSPDIPGLRNHRLFPLFHAPRDGLSAPARPFLPQRRVPDVHHELGLRAHAVPPRPLEKGLSRPSAGHPADESSAAWAGHIDTRSLRGTSPADVQALVTSLQALSYRMQGLLEARAAAAGGVPGAGTAEGFQGLASAGAGGFSQVFPMILSCPASGAEAFRNRLSEIMEHMEQRIEQTLDKAAEGQLSEKTVRISIACWAPIAACRRRWSTMPGPPAVSTGTAGAKRVSDGERRFNATHSK